ncbi:hypothetical protein ACLB2K_008754 [Fragaria x ananassa]
MANWFIPLGHHHKSSRPFPSLRYPPRHHVRHVATRSKQNPTPSDQTTTAQIYQGVRIQIKWDPKRGDVLVRKWRTCGSGGDVTPDHASPSSSSPSAKRRRDQAVEESADISVPPVANDVVIQHSGDFAPVVNAVVVSVPPVANDVVMDNGDVSVSPAVVVAGVDVISVPLVVNDVMDGCDVSVPPPANDVDAVIVDVWAFPPVNGVVAKSGGDISIPPAVNGVVSVPPVFNDNDVIGDISVPPAENDVVAVMVDVWDPPPTNDVVMASDDETLSELTRLLDLNNGVATPETSLTFAENPSRSPRVFQTMSTSYVTINGNEESCGSSFSDADSSVMASVDMSQVWMGGHEWYTAESAWDMDDAEMWAREVIEAPELDADWDDAALARFLGEDLNPDQPFSGIN